MVAERSGEENKTASTFHAENITEESNENVVEETSTEIKIDDTKIKTIFDQLLAKNVPMYIKYKATINNGHGDEDAIVTYAKKDEMVYADTVTEPERVTVLIKDGKAYSILNEHKTYMELDVQDVTIIDNIVDSKILKNAKITKGKETISGTEYDYEEIFSDGEYNRFYYTKGTSKLKYWKLSDGQLLEILEYGNDIDEKLFEIPTEYIMVSPLAE